MLGVSAMFLAHSMSTDTNGAPSSKLIAPSYDEAGIRIFLLNPPYSQQQINTQNVLYNFQIVKPINYTLKFEILSIR